MYTVTSFWTIIDTDHSTLQRKRHISKERNWKIRATIVSLVGVVTRQRPGRPKDKRLEQTRCPSSLRGYTSEPPPVSYSMG